MVLKDKEDEIQRIGLVFRPSEHIGEYLGQTSTLTLDTKAGQQMALDIQQNNNNNNNNSTDLFNEQN